MHFNLLLVWQKQKHKGKEGGWEEWAAVLEGGMLDAEERWTRWSLLLCHSVCMCVCTCVGGLHCGHVHDSFLSCMWLNLSFILQGGVVVGGRALISVCTLHVCIIPDGIGSRANSYADQTSNMMCWYTYILHKLATQDSDNHIHLSCVSIHSMWPQYILLFKIENCVTVAHIHCWYHVDAAMAKAFVTACICILYSPGGCSHLPPSLTVTCPSTLPLLPSPSESRRDSGLQAPVALHYRLWV